MRQNGKSPGNPHPASSREQVKKPGQNVAARCSQARRSQARRSQASKFSKR